MLIHDFLFSIEFDFLLQTYYKYVIEKTEKERKKYNRYCAERMRAYRLRLKAKAQAAREEAQAKAQAAQNQAQEGITH